LREIALNRYFARVLTIVSVAAVTACSSGTTNPALPAAVSNAAQIAGVDTGHVRPACPQTVQPGYATCDMWIRTDVPRTQGEHPFVNGYGPPDLQAAYNLPSAKNGKGQTVAIVDAYDNPNAESDLAVYRSYFKLPACTTKNGCFTKVSQSGSTTKFPKPNAGWAGEMSLDLDMVSAVCPNCKIIVVEATSNRLISLAKSVDRAVLLGANVVTNSYGGAGGGSSNSHFDHPGTVITASSGDGGHGPQSPCDYATVVCVGGTTLIKGGSGRGWTETAWPGAGSGCARLVAKPKWQTDKGCAYRSESDVSSVASPYPGVAFYDTYPSGGWGTTGGTSASSPAIAAVFALAGNASKQNYAAGLWANGGSPGFYDITSGSNGDCKQNQYICTAGPGYDGPTGWGTPNGVSAF
jgi:subtilase family serine protease